jgi:hypothetical protein
MLISSRARALVAGVALLAVLVSARLYAATITPQIGGGIGQFDGGVSGPAGAPAAPLAGALLLEDGTSILLLEDGTSQFCLEGGC